MEVSSNPESLIASKADPNPLFFVSEEELGRIRALECGEPLRTRIFAMVCRLNALYMIARAGSGHIGSSFSSLDIFSWIYLNELVRANDLFFSSKGHDAPGLYAVMIGVGLLEFDRLHTLRRLNGLPGHPDIGTPNIVTNTGSLGMGVSKAKGMALSYRLRGEKGRIFVMTGDGELQEGQFWESLLSAVNQGLGEITVIVDHNKIQSDTWVKNVDDLGNLEAKLNSFGWHVVRCDGNDLHEFSNALARSQFETERPSVIIADTVKGKGVSFMESAAMGPQEEFYCFHSGAPREEEYRRAVSELGGKVDALLLEAGADPLRLESIARPTRAAPLSPQKLVAAYSIALVKQGSRHSELVALDADLILDCGLIPFRDAFPDRFFECGIAEQDMVSQAGGMARQGLLPVVHSFACFLSTRPNEQIYNNSTERTKVIYVGSLAGLLPGGPGHSHQSVRDISALAAIPGMEMIEPSCEREVGMVLDYAVNGTENSIYIRLVSIPCDIPYRLPENYRLEEGRGVILTEGDDAVLIGYGPVLLSQAFEAARLLEENHGIGLRIVNLPWLNRVDADWLGQVVNGVRHIFTMDNHYVKGGQGEMVAAKLAETGPGLKISLFGLREFPACGQNDEVLRHHQLDAKSLVSSILNHFSR